jgi:membrane protease subunit (stomatin/prohibitin family)
MGGMMHQDGNMPMEDDPMEQVEDSRNGEGMEHQPDMDSEDMGKIMEEMMGDEHHQAMSNAMKTMHAEHHQQPAAQPQKPAEQPQAQPGQQVPDEHNQHHQ